jgi:hypothetical protein
MSAPTLGWVIAPYWAGIGQLRRLLHVTSHESAKAAAVMAHEIRNAVPISFAHSQYDTVASSRRPHAALHHRSIRYVTPRAALHGRPAVLRGGTFCIVRCVKRCERCEIEVGLMTLRRRSSSETVKNALLWGVGVVAPILLMLILIWGEIIR